MKRERFKVRSAYKALPPAYQPKFDIKEHIALIKRLIECCELTRSVDIDYMHRGFEFMPEEITVTPKEPEFVIEGSKSEILMRNELRKYIVDLYKVLKEHPKILLVAKIDSPILELVSKVTERTVTVGKERERLIDLPSVVVIDPKSIAYLHARAKWFSDRAVHWESACVYGGIYRYYGMIEFKLCISTLESMIDGKRNPKTEMNLKYISIMLARVKKGVEVAESKLSKEQIIAACLNENFNDNVTLFN